MNSPSSALRQYKRKEALLNETRTLVAGLFFTIIQIDALLFTDDQILIMEKARKVACGYLARVILPLLTAGFALMLIRSAIHHTPAMAVTFWTGLVLPLA